MTGRQFSILQEGHSRVTVRCSQGYHLGGPVAIAKVFSKACVSTPAGSPAMAVSRGHDRAQDGAWSQWPKPTGYWLTMPTPLGVCICASVLLMQ